MLKNQRLNTSKIVPARTAGAKEARLQYRLLETSQPDDCPISLLLVQLETGRHHQIRVQLSGAGYPLWGDAKYGKAVYGAGPGLWSYALRFQHPKDGLDRLFTCEPPAVPPFSFFSDISGIKAKDVFRQD